MHPYPDPINLGSNRFTMAQLLINNADGSPSVYEIQGLVTIGRHQDSTVVLDHVSVSGHHAELTLYNGAYLLKDLLSSNGTFVNGDKILARQLADGDRIRFGEIEASVSIEPMPEIESPVPITPPPLLNDPRHRG